MEETTDASESDAADPDPSPEPSRALPGLVRRGRVPVPAGNRSPQRRPPFSRAGLAILVLSQIAALGLAAPAARADALERVHRTGIAQQQDSDAAV